MLRKIAIMIFVVAFAVIVAVAGCTAARADYTPDDHLDMSEDIKQLEDTKEAMHQLADNARRCGYSDDSTLVQACKTIWHKADSDIIGLKKLEAYTYDNIMCFTNTVFGESGLTGIDSLMQETTMILQHHLDRGLAGSIDDLLRLRLPSGYYVWYPKYATQEYADEQMKLHPDEYARARENVLIALSGRMDHEVPANVIYADTQPHGSSIWKTYQVNTGWYASTVYLCFA